MCFDLFFPQYRGCHFGHWNRLYRPTVAYFLSSSRWPYGMLLYLLYVLLIIGYCIGGDPWLTCSWGLILMFVEKLPISVTYLSIFGQPYFDTGCHFGHRNRLDWPTVAYFLSCLCWPYSMLLFLLYVLLIIGYCIEGNKQFLTTWGGGIWIWW